MCQRETFFGFHYFVNMLQHGTGNNCYGESLGLWKLG